MSPSGTGQHCPCNGDGIGCHASPCEAAVSRCRGISAEWVRETVVLHSSERSEQCEVPLSFHFKAGSPTVFTPDVCNVLQASEQVEKLIETSLQMQDLAIPAWTRWTGPWHGRKEIQRQLPASSTRQGAQHRSVADGAGSLQLKETRSGFGDLNSRFHGRFNNTFQQYRIEPLPSRTEPCVFGNTEPN